MSKIFFPQTISNAVFNIGSTALGGPQSQSDFFPNNQQFNKRFISRRHIQSSESESES